MAQKLNCDSILTQGNTREELLLWGRTRTGLIAPHGEHLAHLLAWAIGFGMRAVDILSMPFYHPVLEEGLRSALRTAAHKSTMPKPQLEMLRCQDSVTG